MRISLAKSVSLRKRPNEGGESKKSGVSKGCCRCRSRGGTSHRGRSEIDLGWKQIEAQTE